MRSTASRVCVPRAISGWFVTTTSGKPAVRQRGARVLRAGLELELLAGLRIERGGPSTTGASMSVPSRSRKTARGRSAHSRPARGVLDERRHRLAQCLARGARRRPAERADALDREPDDRHVALPAAVAARELVPDVCRVEADALGGEVGDLRDRDVVAGRDVVDARTAPSPRGAARSIASIDVVDVDVRLALRPVPEDAESRRVVEQRAHEVEARRRASAAARRRCRSGRRGPDRPNMKQYAEISASPASLLAP